jgi:hypothetical protein
VVVAQLALAVLLTALVVLEEAVLVQLLVVEMPHLEAQIQAVAVVVLVQEHQALAALALSLFATQAHLLMR